MMPATRRAGGPARGPRPRIVSSYFERVVGAEDLRRHGGLVRAAERREGLAQQQDACAALALAAEDAAPSSAVRAGRGASAHQVHLAQRQAVETEIGQQLGPLAARGSSAPGAGGVDPPAGGVRRDLLAVERSEPGERLPAVEVARVAAGHQVEVELARPARSGPAPRGRGPSSRGRAARRRSRDRSRPARSRCRPRR